MKNKFADNRGCLSGGYVERRDGVSVEADNGVYHVKRRATEHPAGGAWESAHTLKEARKIAAKLRREPGPEGLTSGQRLT